MEQFWFEISASIFSLKSLDQYLLAKFTESVTAIKIAVVGEKIIMIA